MTSGRQIAGNRRMQMVLDVLEESRTPLAVSEIAEAIAARFGERLTTRQIAYLLQQADPERVEADGERRGRRYRNRPHATGVPAPSTPKEVDGGTPTDATEAPVIALSPEATTLRDAIRRPVGARTPVGYDRDWLFGYTPGTTWYLPAELRAHLRRIGTPPGGERPVGTFARDILTYLTVDLAWASSHLEGNTYSLLDTRNLLEFGLEAEGKDADEAEMILNHKRAIDLLVREEPPLALDEFSIRSLHGALSENLMDHPTQEGRLREGLVGIGDSVYQPTGIPQVIAECFSRLLATAARIPDPFEASFFLLVHLPYLQPFHDVNKRTSRLAANIPLVTGNLCPLSFVDVPPDSYLEGLLAVYELRKVELLRDVFRWAYERSCARYLVVRDAIPHPDRLRQRFRAQLDEIVAEIVRNGIAPQRSVLQRWAIDHGIPGSDRGAFSEKALELLLALNDASASRLWILPAEFHEWRDRFKPR